MTKLPNRQQISWGAIAGAYRLANKRLLLLDYDGTLVDFAPRPEQAKPSTRSLTAIKKLAADPRNTIVIISGRDKSTLDSWLGHLPVQFVAEHGAFEKVSGTWLPTVRLDTPWKEEVRPIMLHFVQTVPGTLIEDKETALAYHYRGATNLAKARAAANQLFQKLSPLVDRLALNVSHSDLTIEVRQSGTDKGKAARAAVDRNNYDFVMCAGDSQTDEDMFMKLAGQAYCIKVGPGETAARYHIDSPEAFIDFLALLGESA